jgi:hypothetical protein
MTSNIDPVRVAREAAEAAQAAAERAIEGAEIQFLDSVTHVKQINERKDSLKLKARYIGVYGYDRWSKLCADSR